MDEVLQGREKRNGIAAELAPAPETGPDGASDSGTSLVPGRGTGGSRCGGW